MNARELVKACPEGTTFSREAVLRLLEDGGQKVVRWVRLVRAGEIMGVEPRKLRRMAARWERMLSMGQAVPVQVSRASTSPESHWLFDEEGCWAWRRENEVKPVLEVEPDIDKAIAGFVAREYA